MLTGNGGRNTRFKVQIDQMQGLALPVNRHLLHRSLPPYRRGRLGSGNRSDRLIH